MGFFRADGFVELVGGFVCFLNVSSGTGMFANCVCLHCVQVKDTSTRESDVGHRGIPLLEVRGGWLVLSAHPFCRGLFSALDGTAAHGLVGLAI